MEGLHVLMYSNLNFSKDNILTFEPFENVTLPFPMNLSMAWRIVIAISLLINLIEGTRLRVIIFKFIKSPDSYLGPINYLIWVDQINGIALALTIFSRILSLILPSSTSSLLGETFCNSILYLSGHYIIGAYTWGCFIAFFRVLFVSGQTWLKKTIGIRTMLHVLLICGSLVVIILSIMLYLSDSTSTYRMCTHISTESSTVVAEYMVIMHKNLIHL
jgi:hypothetical protein